MPRNHMKKFILWVLLFFFFYFLPEMVGGIRIEKSSFEVAFILTLLAMLATDWLRMISSGRVGWGEKKQTNKE